MPRLRPLSQTKFINDANLVASYKLEDVNDSKNSYHLTNNGTTPFNSALFNNGADGGTTNTGKYLKIANNLGITGGNITVSTWIKLNTEVGSGSYGIFNQESVTNKVGYFIDYEYNSGTRRLNFGRLKKGVSYTSAFYTVTLGTSNWYNLILTFDGSTLVGYLNGVNVGSVSTSGNGTSGTTFDLFGIMAGQADNNWGSYLSGIMDDTNVFSRALSAGEVAELYQSMTLGEYLPNSNTKLLLHLNGSSADSSGNNNNGTDTNITYSNGKFGKCAGPTGTNIPDITCTSADFNVTTGDATWSFWVNSTSYPASDAFTPFFLGGGYNVSGYYSQIASDGKIQILFCRSGAVSFLESAAGVISTNNWYNCVFTKSGTTATIYVNGKNVVSATMTNPATGGNNLVLLNYGAGKVYRGPATIDEFLFNNVAWTPQQVQKYFTYSKARFGI
jgi:hypothetical protein